MTRIVVPCLVLATLVAAAPAAARSTATGPGDAFATVCLADPGRTLAWLDGVRTVALRLGLTGKGMEWLSGKSRTELGADLTGANGWLALGLDPAAPICLHLRGAGHTPVVSFGVTDEKRLRAAAGRLAAAVGATGRPVPAPVPLKAGRLKGWTWPGKAKSQDGLSLVAADRAAWLTSGKGDLSFLGADERDSGVLAGVPASDLALAASVDLAASANKTLKDLATSGWPSVRARLVVANGAADFELRAPNGEIPASVGRALEKAVRPPSPGSAALVPASASGFVQVRVPPELLRDLPAVLRGKGGAAKATPPAGPVFDLLASLRGDTTLWIEDGLAGLVLAAPIADPDRCQRALAELASAAGKAGTALSDTPIEIEGVPGHLFRLGAPDATLRLPILAVVKDGVLYASWSRIRLVDALAGSRARYLDDLAGTPASEALAGNALLVAHGWGTDVLGGLPAWTALLRDALSDKALRWMDLIDLPVLALDLLLDSNATLSVGPAETVLALHARFLSGDPMASDPRQRAFGMALRTRVSGRLAAFRGALLDLVRGGTTDPVGRKSLRLLLDSHSLSDMVLAAGAAAWLMASQKAPPSAAAEETQTPCQKYLMAACIGRDPEGPECRDARKHFEGETGQPTDKDEAECEKQMKRLK
jgi:hypothetical protein